MTLLLYMENWSGTQVFHLHKMPEKVCTVFSKPKAGPPWEGTARQPLTLEE